MAVLRDRQRSHLVVCDLGVHISHERLHLSTPTHSPSSMSHQKALLSGVWLFLIIYCRGKMRMRQEQFETQRLEDGRFVRSFLRHHLFVGFVCRASWSHNLDTSHARPNSACHPLLFLSISKIAGYS